MNNYICIIYIYYLPSHNGMVAEHISLWTIWRSHPNIWAFSGIKKDRVLIEIPLPQVTEHADQLLHSEASHPGNARSSNILLAEKERKNRYNTIWVALL